LAAGDITFITNAFFDAGRGMTPDVVHVSGDVFAIAYRGPDNDGWVCTLTITSAGAVGAVIDSLEFEADRSESTCILHVTGDVFAIAYWNQTLDDGILITVDIDAAGNIGAVLDTFTFDAVRGRTPDIIHIAGDVYAIAYNGPPDNSHLCTITIDNAGNIGGATIDTWVFDAAATSGHDCHIIHIFGDVYAIAYTGAPVSRGRVCTFTIDNAGNIGGAFIDTFQYAAWSGSQHIIHITGDVYAIAYTFFTGADNHGIVCTLTIDNAGNIGDPVIDTLTWDGVQGINSDFINVAGDIYAIAARGAGDGGWLYTVEIAADGQIGDAVLDTLEFDDRTTETPRLIQVAGSVFAIAYAYFIIPIPGYVATVDIESGAKGMRGLNPALMEVLGY